MPSGGLSVERSTTERELFGSPKQERLDQMRGKTVWIIGEHLADYLSETARAFIEDCHAANVVVITRTAEAFEAMKAQLDDDVAQSLTSLVKTAA